MSTAQIRQQVHQYVDQLDDNFLQIVHAMMETYAKQQELPTDVPGLPASDEEIMESIERAEAQIAKGEYYTIEELEEKTEQWLNTKS
jgi:antitoxin component of RelBE/YafQ-DinJ toxin-antitoxin module